MINYILYSLYQLYPEFAINQCNKLVTKSKLQQLIQSPAATQSMIDENALKYFKWKY